MANILGINLSEMPVPTVLEKIGGFLIDDNQHYLVTPNPEIILSSHKDEELFYILNQADLAMADGFGLKIAGILDGVKIPRLTGADLVLDLLKLAENKKIKITVLNWQDGLSSQDDIEKSLKSKYPELNYLVIDADRSRPLAPEIIEQINGFASALLFCTFGSPYQEKIIYHNLKKLPSVRLALGIGGAFDFLTGRAARAPKAVRILGLEWLWRLIQQPKRIKRIYNATAVFTCKLLKNKIVPFLYRPNVVCLLYKKEGVKKKIVIVERESDPGCWQLPQGGTDGENLTEAGSRELCEELNTDKFIIKGVFKNVHKYLFPPASEENLLTHAKRYRFSYKGQKQGLLIAEFTGRDENIKINFWDHLAWKWIEEENLIANLETRRQPGAKIFLEKFQSLNL